LGSKLDADADLDFGVTDLGSRRDSLWRKYALSDVLVGGNIREGASGGGCVLHSRPRRSERDPDILASLKCFLGGCLCNRLPGILNDRAQTTVKAKHGVSYTTKHEKPGH